MPGLLCDNETWPQGAVNTKRPLTTTANLMEAGALMGKSDPTRSCAIEGCTRPYRARGWCGTHYAAARRENRIPDLRRHPRRDNRERVFALVDQSGGADACWPWVGASDRRGYGRTYLLDGMRFRGMAAHRAAYILVKGEIPDGQYVLHGCDNPPCCNPAHLRAGTPQENMDDRHRSGLKKPNGSWLPKAPAIPAATVAAVRAAYIPRVKGHTLRAVAADFGLDQAMVFNIVNRRGRWAESA